VREINLFECFFSEGIEIFLERVSVLGEEAVPGRTRLSTQLLEQVVGVLGIDI